MNSEKITELAAQVVAAYVSHNAVPVGDLPRVLGAVRDALVATGSPPEPAPVELVPAVDPRKSVAPDHVVCLECGKKFKSMRRHLVTAHGFSVDEYRKRWDLVPTHPVVAPAYGALRSGLAKQSGLGTKNGAAASA